MLLDALSIAIIDAPWLLVSCTPAEVAMPSAIWSLTAD